MSEYGIELKDVSDELPFMGEHGCVVEPYLRTTCTKYHCHVRGIGPPPEGEWADIYFRLIDDINKEETV